MPLSDSMSSGDSFQAPDRRQNPRHAPNSLSYVHLEESNGGILINVSEGGLAVHAAVSVMEDDLQRIRLQIPRSAKWLETSARVVWSRDSRRMVGIEFLELQEDTRKQIREWLAHERGENTAPPEPSADEREIRAANVEEIPMKPMRRSPQSRVQALSAAEFDVAALLSSREVARVAVARAMKIPTDSTQPVTATSVTKEAPAEVSAAPARKQGGRQKTYVPILAVLALFSLLAGWEAGKGTMFQTLRALFLPSSAASPAAKLGTAGPGGAFATNFEVIAANNQAWLVPFSGPTSAPAGPALPALPPKVVASLNQPAPRNSNSFRPASLTPPQSARSKSTQLAASAPVLPTPQGGTPLPTSIAEAGPNFGLVPPTVQQTQPAQPHSSLIEPKLLHSVQPIYPSTALNQHIEGNVTVHAHIMENGSVTDVKAVSGPALLGPAAVSAVRMWKYTPEILDGRDVASDVVVTVQFTLPH